MKVEIICAKNASEMKTKLQNTLNEYAYKMDRDEDGRGIIYSYRDLQMNAMIDTNKKPLMIATIIFDEIIV